MGNEGVPKIILNNTVSLLFKTAICVLVISNHNNFQLLFDKIASVYFTRCYFNVHSKADMSQLNLPHGKKTTKRCKAEKKHTRTHPFNGPFSSRQTTMPEPRHLVFYRSDALPATQPTASKHWSKATKSKKRICSKVTVKVWVIHVVSCEEEKGKAAVGRICRKRRF